MTVQKPLILFCANGVYGHLLPVQAIAKEMVARGFDVTFVTATARKERIESIGARFIPLEGERADFTEPDIPRLGPNRNSIPPGPLQVAYDIENIFIASIPGQYASLQTALKTLTEEHPGRPIILGYEGIFMGAVALLLDSPGIKPTASFGIGIMPIGLSSIDTAPFGPGLPPDSSTEGRTRNVAMNKEIHDGIFAKPMARFHEIMREIGVKGTAPFFFDAPYMVPDRYLQMCIPSAEYPRSDAPPTLQFAGCVPKGHRDPFTDTPTWWPEVTQNKTKTIIFVSQGTALPIYSKLIIPTMKAFEDRSDILIVVALGERGATLPEGTIIPENARVMDWIPYDEILPHAKVFVTNGGYGGFQHALSNGTPMVVAGAGEDKPEVAARAEWAGIGINLRTGTPSVEQVREAVEKVFGDDKYKKRGQELEEEMKSYDAMGIIQSTVEELAARK